MIGVLLLFAAAGLAGQAVDPAALSQQARQALAQGRYEAAAGLYRQLAAQLPQVAGLRMNLGLALFQGGSYREAAAELQTALKMDASLSPAYLLLGLCHAKLGEPASAIVPLERAVKADPNNGIAVLELGDAYYALGRYAPAVEQFRRLTALRPSDPLAWRGLGLSLTEQSQVLFGQLAPQSPEALTLLARARLASDEPKAAYALLRQALQKNPLFGPAHALLAELFQKTGHPDWAAAAQVKATPPSGPYAAIVAASEEALAALHRLAALGPSAALYETEAEAARARGAYPEAVAAWRKALALQPGQANLERGLARALFTVKEYEEALPLLTKHALEHELGEALLETGKPAAAIPHLLRATSLHAQAALGRAYLAADQPAKAIAPLRAALSVDADGSLHFQLARALQRTGAVAQYREMDRLSQQLRQKKAEQQQTIGSTEIAPL